jgi:hypothetical protein
MCSDVIGGRGRKELDVTTTRHNIKEKPEPNLYKVINNIQDELVVSNELVVFVEPIIFIT